MVKQEHTECPWCGAWGRLFLMGGHYACSRCRRPVLDCCDGEKAEPDKDSISVRYLPSIKVP